MTPDFISEEEEALLAQELEPQLRRHRYQDDHWDGVGGSAWLRGKLSGGSLGPILKLKCSWLS